MSYPNTHGMTPVQKSNVITAWHATQLRKAQEIQDAPPSFTETFTVPEPECNKRPNDRCGNCNWCKGHEASLARSTAARCQFCGRINCGLGGGIPHSRY